MIEWRKEKGEKKEKKILAQYGEPEPSPTHGQSMGAAMVFPHNPCQPELQPEWMRMA